MVGPPRAEAVRSGPRLERKRAVVGRKSAVSGRSGTGRFERLVLRRDTRQFPAYLSIRPPVHPFEPSHMGTIADPPNGPPLDCNNVLNRDSTTLPISQRERLTLA